MVEAIAMAGGLTQDAKLKNILIIRIETSMEEVESITWRGIVHLV